MDEEIITNVLIDQNLGSYQQFFDHEWCKRIFETVKASSLKESVASLLVAWRSTNGTHLLPWLMVNSLRQFADGEKDGSFQFRAAYSAAVVHGIVEKIENRMHYNLKLDQRRKLKSVVKQIEEEAFDAFKTAQSAVKFDVTEYWKFLTHTSEFNFCIIGTQRITFASLFFAYEDFIANVIRTKDANYTSKSKKNPINTAFACHFGDPLANLCWNHDEIELAKLIRNALVHNNGRKGTELDKHNLRFVDVTGVASPALHDNVFNVVNGTIQITPGNTTYLFGVLKERVTEIVGKLA